MRIRSLPRELRPNLWDALVVLAVAALALGSAGAVWGSSGRGAGSLTAVVTIDGQETDRFSPADLLRESRTYTNNGYTLTVTCGVRGEPPAEDRRESPGECGVQVSWADCPTQDCVRTGPIFRSGQSVICLPARIIVRLEGAAAEGAVDAVLG